MYCLESRQIYDKSVKIKSYMQLTSFKQSTVGPNGNFTAKLISSPILKIEA